MRGIIGTAAALGLSILAAPSAAHAQQNVKIARIGVIGAITTAAGDVMARWRIEQFRGRKVEQPGTIEANDEREAIDKAAEQYGFHRRCGSKYL